MAAGTQDGGRFAATAAIPSWASGAAKNLADSCSISANWSLIESGRGRRSSSLVAANALGAPRRSMSTYRATSVSRSKPGTALLSIECVGGNARHAEAHRRFFRDRFDSTLVIRCIDSVAIPNNLGVHVF